MPSNRRLVIILIALLVVLVVLLVVGRFVSSPLVSAPAATSTPTRPVSPEERDEATRRLEFAAPQPIKPYTVKQREEAENNLDQAAPPASFLGVDELEQAWSALDAQ